LCPLFFWFDVSLLVEALPCSEAFQPRTETCGVAQIEEAAKSRIAGSIERNVIMRASKLRSSYPEMLTRSNRVAPRELPIGQRELAAISAS
jgi:hypothetical protein